MAGRQRKEHSDEGPSRLLLASLRSHDEAGVWNVEGKKTKEKIALPG